MNKPVFRVIGLEHATCDHEYCGCDSETHTHASSSHTPSPETQPLETVTLKLKDLLPAVTALAARRSWVDDFTEDPVVVTRDFYEVLLTYQRLRRAG